jgi:predicted RNA-binding Zn-ribbon protein involved in translation (DUF1610 family)
MRLRKTEEAEPGSLSVVYECPACGYEMAMLTNAQETQMVRSLGVRIGPAQAAGEAASTSGGKCPFSSMLPAKDTATDTTGPSWTAGALARLESIPEMVRPMARAGIEMVAKESGHQVIDEEVLSAARARFGM